MTSTPHVSRGFSRLVTSAAMAASLLMLAGTASAQSAVNVETLKFQLQKQKFALQEAIADREATAFRVEEINSMLSESEEINSQLEEEVKVLCEEMESLKPGTYDECVKSSSN